MPVWRPTQIIEACKTGLLSLADVGSVTLDMTDVRIVDALLQTRTSLPQPKYPPSLFAALAAKMWLN